MNYAQTHSGFAGTTANTVTRLEQRDLVTTVRKAPPGVDVQVLVDCSPNRMFQLLTDYRRLPDHIFGLESADVLERKANFSTVRFTMKFPFPLGRVTWTNLIEYRDAGTDRSIEWTLLDGDLRVNDGRLLLKRYNGRPDITHAFYSVSVESKSRLPKSAERLATRWLLPKIVGKLRRIAEQG